MYPEHLALMAVRQQSKRQQQEYARNPKITRDMLAGLEWENPFKRIVRRIVALVTGKSTRENPQPVPDAIRTNGEYPQVSLG